MAAIDKEITRISTPGKNPLTGNPDGPAIKDATPEGKTYYMHLIHQRSRLMSGSGASGSSIAPVTPGMSPGYAIVPGVGRVAVPSAPTIGSASRAVSPPRAKATPNRYAGMTDAQIRAEYARQSGRR